MCQKELEGKKKKPKKNKKTNSLAWVSVIVVAKFQDELLGDSMKQRNRNVQVSHSVKAVVANE